MKTFNQFCLEEENKSCGKGMYYCRDKKKCMPIPEGHHVMKDGTLMKGEKHGMEEEKKNCGCGKDPCITSVSYTHLTLPTTPYV